MLLLLHACAGDVVCPDLEPAEGEAVVGAEIFPIPEADALGFEEGTMTWHWDETDQESLTAVFGERVCRTVPADTPVRVSGLASWQEGAEFSFCKGDEWETVAEGDAVLLQVELWCDGGVY